MVQELWTTIHCILLKKDFMWGIPAGRGIPKPPSWLLWLAGALAMINILVSFVITCVEEKTLDRDQESWVLVFVFIIINTAAIIANTFWVLTMNNASCLCHMENILILTVMKTIVQGQVANTGWEDRTWTWQSDARTCVLFCFIIEGAKIVPG